MGCMEQTGARNRSQAKYDKAHTKGIYLKLNLRTGKDIIWWTWNQQSVQGSIKRLIRGEMWKNTQRRLSNELCIVINWYVTRVFFRHSERHSFSIWFL